MGYGNDSGENGPFEDLANHVLQVVSSNVIGFQ